MRTGAPALSRSNFTTGGSTASSVCAVSGPAGNAMIDFSGAWIVIVTTNGSAIVTVSGTTVHEIAGAAAGAAAGDAAGTGAGAAT